MEDDEEIRPFSSHVFSTFTFHSDAKSTNFQISLSSQANSWFFVHQTSKFHSQIAINIWNF